MISGRFGRWLVGMLVIAVVASACTFGEEMAEDAGTSTEGWSSWDELIADAQQLTVIQDGAMVRAGYNFSAGDGLAHSLLSLILQAGGSYLNEDGTAFTFNTPEGQEALGLLKRMADA